VRRPEGRAQTRTETPPVIRHRDPVYSVPQLHPRRIAQLPWTARPCLTLDLPSPVVSPEGAITETLAMSRFLHPLLTFDAGHQGSPVMVYVAAIRAWLEREERSGNGQRGTPVGCGQSVRILLQKRATKADKIFESNSATVSLPVPASQQYSPSNTGCPSNVQMGRWEHLR